MVRVCQRPKNCKRSCDWLREVSRSKWCLLTTIFRWHRKFTWRLSFRMTQTKTSWYRPRRPASPSKKATSCKYLVKRTYTGGKRDTSGTIWKDSYRLFTWKRGAKRLCRTKPTFRKRHVSALWEFLAFWEWKRNHDSLFFYPHLCFFIFSCNFGWNTNRRCFHGIRTCAFLKFE